MLVDDGLRSAAEDGPRGTPGDGFRRQRFTHGEGGGYETIFASEYGGSVASATFATADSRYEYTVVGDEDLSLRTMRATGGRRGGTIGPRQDHVVFWLTAGTIEMHFADRFRQLTPGAPYIASASEAYRFEASDTEYRGLHLRDGFLRRVGRELGFRLPDGPLLFEQQDEVIARREPLRRLLHTLVPALLDDRVRGPMRAALNRRVAVVVLDTFPLRGRDDVPLASRLRDAIAFVEANARRPVSVPEMAAASGLSERGLRDVFGRTLGTTPLRFVRDHRLDEVRRELLRAPLDTGAVDLARAWGFGNQGRFARAYRERHGEDPSETLRSSSSAEGTSRVVAAALRYMAEHRDRDLTTAQVARAVGLGPRRLQERFRAELGTTPARRLAELRASPSKATHPAS